jgi:hypothetical protein
MTCARFSSEIYAFYALGLAEADEREQIIDHLRNDCATCRAALDEASAFWYVFGATTASREPAPIRMPGPALKRRILNSIEPVSLWRTVVPAWTWSRAAAGGVIVIGVAATAWTIGQSSLRTQLKDQQAVLQRQSEQIRNLQAQSAVAAPQPAPVVIPAPAVATPPANTQGDLQAVRQQLAAEQARDALAQALADEQTRTTALETRIAASDRDVADKTAQLATAARNLDDAERRYREANQLAQRNAQDRDAIATQRDTAETALRRRITELEGQVTESRRVADSQQQQLQQHLRMAAMLRSPSVTMVRLQATEAARNAYGVAVQNGSRLMFYASNLPRPAAGRTYQLWLLRDRGPAIVSGGTFSASGGDAPVIEFTQPAMLANVRGIAVTEEPVGGSPLPTGHKLLVGTPKT